MPGQSSNFQGSVCPPPAVALLVPEREINMDHLRFTVKIIFGDIIQNST